MNRIFSMLLVFLLVLLAAPTFGQINFINMTQWKVEDGGNDHWYGVMAVDHYWSEAYAAAQTQEHDGQLGYLATVTSQLENDFIFGNITNGVTNTSYIDQYFMGGVYSNGAWQWLNGETWAYTNWSPDEPNNPDDEGGWIEDRVSMWGSGSYPEAEGGGGIPGMWNNTLLECPYTFWSIVEWGDPATSINDPFNSGQYPEPGADDVIPEPATCVLFAIGIVGFGLAVKFKYSVS